ncbi:MAG: hypothetical protein QW820_04060 [Sulfolobales archaeon]
MYQQVNDYEGFEYDVRNLLILWLDNIFGPLYYVTFSIRLSKFRADPPEHLLIFSPQSFYDALIQTFGSELIAESFICTLLTYARNLGMNDLPAREEFVRWFKNNDAEKVRLFLRSLIMLMKRG